MASSPSSSSATNRAANTKTRESKKHAQVRWVKTDAIPEEFVDTTASALRRCLAGGPQVSLDGWGQRS